MKVFVPKRTLKINAIVHENNLTIDNNYVKVF